MSEEIKPEAKVEVQTETKAKSKIKPVAKKEKIAIVLIRGMNKVSSKIVDTLFILRLRKKHTCVVIENSDVNRNMIKKVKDYVTYGEIDEATLKELISKRGKPNPKKEGMTKPFFELAPPRGGFERKGTKKPFTVGGALGYRGNKINDLIRKML